MLIAAHDDTISIKVWYWTRELLVFIAAHNDTISIKVWYWTRELLVLIAAHNDTISIKVWCAVHRVEACAHFEACAQG